MPSHFTPAELDRMAGALEERVCSGCECTDDSPCHDEATGQPCYWIADDMCSVCARTLLALAEKGQVEDSEGLGDYLRELLRRGDKELAAVAADQRVEVFSPAEAQRWLERTRLARARGAA